MTTVPGLWIQAIHARMTVARRLACNRMAVTAFAQFRVKDKELGIAVLEHYLHTDTREVCSLWAAVSTFVGFGDGQRRG